MSDYTQITDFSVKDGLTTGDPEKIILGADFDGEFSALSTAIASKYDSNDVASTAQAKALLLDTVIITPSGLNDVLANGAGMAYDIQQLADPGADRILFWDNSAVGVAGLAVSTGLTLSATTLTSNDAAIVHDNLSGFVADEHIAHSGVNFTAGLGLTGGGTIAATRDFAVGAGNGITVNANDVALTDVTKGAGQPLSLLSGVWDFDITALDAATASASLAGTESIIMDEGGTNKKVALTAMGMRVQTAQATQSLAVTDMNTIMQFSAAATLTLPNSTLTLGAPVVIMNNHASDLVTIALAASAELESVYHPGSVASVTDTVDPGGTAVIYQTASGKWKLSGDISD